VYLDTPWDSTCIKLKYETITNQKVREMPIGGLLDKGYIFLKVINSKI
jgi:N6-adenosine-specific RNA methylase IME4